MSKKFIIKAYFFRIFLTILLICLINPVIIMIFNSLGERPISNASAIDNISLEERSISNASAIDNISLGENIVLVAANQDTAVVTYPEQVSATASNTYSLSVNGQPVFVEKYNSISYAHFAFSGKADIDISLKENVNQYTISPKSYNIPSSKNGNQIFFSLTNPRKLILHNVNSLPEKLFIIADSLEQNPPQLKDTNVVNIIDDYGVDNSGVEDITEKTQQAIEDVANLKGVLYFPPGRYKTRQLNLKSNMTLYLAGGAILEAVEDAKPSYGKGILNLENISNVRITGRGLINGNGSYWRPNGGWYSLIKILNANNVTLDGIILRDAAVANVSINYSEDINLSDIKILAEPNPYFVNTDGIVFWSSRNISINNILYKGTDDFTSHGGDKNGLIQDNENITVGNAVVYTDGTGGAFKIGTTAKQGFIRKINYENIDVVNTAVIAGLWPVTGANFEDITFNNIRVENIIDFPRKEEYQGPLSLFNFRIIEASWEENSFADNLGYIRNIYFKNLILDDPGVNNSLFQGYDSARDISNITFDNCYLEGKLLTKPEDAYLTFLPSRKDGNTYVNVKFTQSQ